MEEPNRFAAARALKGCAIGDCLGIYYENGKHPPPGDDWKGDRYDYGTAIWTDDTQQSAVLLIDYLNDKDQRIDPARVMNAFVAMSEDGTGRFGTHRGTGQGFRHAVTQWRALGHAAPMPGRQGNGAAMRVAAVAYAMPRTTGSREQIRAVSSATHEAGIAIDAALAVAEAAWLMREGRTGRDLVAELSAQDALGSARPLLQVGLEAMRGRPPEADLSAALAALSAKTGMPAGDGHASCGPISAIFIAATFNNFHASIVHAIRLGGDTDSTAAIAGALAAGAHGIDPLLRQLDTFCGREHVERFASETPPTIEEWRALERNLCERLSAVRSKG